MLLPYSPRSQPTPRRFRPRDKREAASDRTRPNVSLTLTKQFETPRWVASVRATLQFNSGVRAIER